MNYNDSLVQLIKNLSQNSDDDTDPNNVLIQQFQAPYENNKVGEAVNTLTWKNVPYWAGALSATLTRNSIAYNTDNICVGYNPRFLDATFGKGVLVEGSITNLLTNPTMRTGSTWAASHNATRTDVTVSPSADGKFPGDATGCTSITVVSGQSFGFLCETINLTVGSSYTLTFYVYVPSSVTAGKAKVAVYYNNIGWVSISSVDVPERDVWVKKSLTFTANATYASTNLCVGINNGIPGDKVYACFGQLEQAPFSTTFENGVRQAEALSIPTAGVLSPTQGTIEVNVNVNSAIKNTSSNRYIFSASDTNGTPYKNSIALSHTTGNTWVAWLSDSIGTQVSVTIADSLSIGLHRFAVRWSAASLDLFIDGVKKGTVASPPIPTAFTPTLSIGSWPYTYGCIYTTLDDLRISNVARSDSDLASAYSSNQPLPIDNYTTAKYNFDGDLNNSMPVLGFNWSQGGKYSQTPEVMKCLMLI